MNLGGVTTKKYVVDPSVTGGVPGGFRSSSTLPYDQQQQKFQPPSGYQPFQPPGSSSFQPLSATFPSSQGSAPLQSFQPGVPSNQFQPQSAFQPPQSTFQPPGSSAITAQPMQFQPQGKSSTIAHI